jgi:hypothetical protein
MLLEIRGSRQLIFRLFGKFLLPFLFFGQIFELSLD